METHYWLMKSEPTCFSIDDLANTPRKTEPWDGVRNYQARNSLQAMKIEDSAFFYHSSCRTPGIAGIIKIVKNAYVDKTAFNPNDPHFDPKSRLNKPRWYCVDVQLIKKFKSLIPLKYLRDQPPLKKMPLLQKGNRLSVMPVTSEEWKVILSYFSHPS